MKNNCPQRLLYPSNLSFIIEGVKTFHDKCQSNFMTTKPVLQDIFKGIIHTEEEG
jgi:hypothetical protein